MDTQTETINKPIRKPKRKPKPQNNYTVTDEYLLYKISDAGLLHLLHGIGRNRLEPNKRCWFFDRHKDIQEIIDQYKKENSKENLNNGQ